MSAPLCWIAICVGASAGTAALRKTLTHTKIRRQLRRRVKNGALFADNSLPPCGFRTDSATGFSLPSTQLQALWNRTAYSAIISSAPPYTCHLIARHLKRKYGLPWIADFRDAWMCDPWRDFAGLPRWRNWTDRWLENRCIASADAVVCITDEMRDDLRRLHRGCSPHKFITITNGFDEIELDQTSLPAVQNRRLFLHLGTLYGDRRIDNFCGALVTLMSRGDLDPASFRLLFVGDTEPSFIASARQHAPELFASGAIEFRPRVDWQEAQRLLMDASVLLLFQGHHKQTVPAKAFEYICAGKPIFAVVDGGALAQVIDSAQLGCWADPDDPSDIAAKFLQTLRLPHRSAHEIRYAARKYHFRFLTEELAGLIRAVTSNQGHATSSVCST